MPSSTASSTDDRPAPPPPGWLAAARNGGWTYRDRVAAADAGRPVSAFYAARHRHSDRAAWLGRLAAGEISRNGRVLERDLPLEPGDRLAWRRPAWIEPAVPAGWSVLFDDGDLLVIDKPAGLPVLPAGGFLEHTLLRRLERCHRGDPAGLPRPVHRLGRFTSGLLVCARRPASRAWLSRLLRGGGAAGCRKEYRTLLAPGRLGLAPGERRRITVPIGRRPHPRLGLLWCAAPGDPAALPACSTLTLLERRCAADLVTVAIATGRPHQIRIHCAALGAPLLGDPLYLPGGTARAEVLPGEGGYRLRSWRLRLPRPGGEPLALEAPLPAVLQAAAPPGSPP